MVKRMVKNKTNQKTPWNTNRSDKRYAVRHSFEIWNRDFQRTWLRSQGFKNTTKDLPQHLYHTFYWDDFHGKGAKGKKKKHLRKQWKHPQVCGKRPETSSTTQTIQLHRFPTQRNRMMLCTLSKRVFPQLSCRHEPQYTNCIKFEISQNTTTRFLMFHRDITTYTVTGTRWLETKDASRPRKPESWIFLENVRLLHLI